MPGNPGGIPIVARETQRALSHKVLILCSDKVQYVSPETMRILTRFLSLSDGWKQKTLQRIDEAEIGGYINHPKFLVPWKRDLLGQFSDSSRRSNESEVLFETAYTYLYPNAGIDNFWRTNPYWFVKELAIEGQAGLISGDRGYGKTDHALYLCELLIRLKQDQIENGKASHFYQILEDRRYRNKYDQMAGGEGKKKEVSGSPFSSKMGLFDSEDIRFPTNISISPKSPYAKYFQQSSRMSEFVLNMCQNAMAGIFSLTVPDEMGFSFNKRRSMSTHNFGIEQILIIIRKFNAGLFAIAQSAENQLPPSLTGSAQTKIQKMSKTTATYDIRGLGVLQHVRNIPHTSIQYATRAFATFSVDMNPELMVGAVADEEHRVHEEGLVEWNDTMMYEATIRWVKANRLTEKEIAEGKSGLLRSEVRALAAQTDPITMKPYTPERIASEYDIELTKVQEILKEVREEEKAQKEKRARKPVLPTAPLPSH